MMVFNLFDMALSCTIIGLSVCCDICTKYSCLFAFMCHKNFIIKYVCHDVQYVMKLSSFMYHIMGTDPVLAKLRHRQK